MIVLHPDHAEPAQDLAEAAEGEPRPAHRAEEEPNQDRGAQQGAS